MLLYLRTARTLKPVQLYGRLFQRMRRASATFGPSFPVRETTGIWRPPAERARSLLGPNRFRLLNRECEVSNPGDWDRKSDPKLLRYNLHYFDDLNAQDAPARSEWHHALIGRWIAENPPAVGIGWQPYPLSLRIVNWIKFALRGEQLGERALRSLTTQARYLSRNCEYHILGNHLLVNAKALFFAGSFFAGSEPDRWRDYALRILVAQMEEQVLDDGGHYELSPMYHALVTEDVLDVLDLAAAYPGILPDSIRQRLATRAVAMLGWLAVMCHPDGEIALFNDSALGVAPSPAQLFRTAAELGLDVEFNGNQGTKYLRGSGYCRMSCGDAVLFADVAAIAARHVASHGHSDVLTFELSLAGRRIIVDSGVSEYEIGPERLRQRGTAAHNTGLVDRENSSEIWLNFRVARRACPFAVGFHDDGERIALSASHDGYRRLNGKVIHRRTWHLERRCLRIRDEFTGIGVHSIDLPFHFHPDVNARLEGQLCSLNVDGTDIRTSITVDPALTPALVPATYHPRFGTSIQTSKLVGSIEPATLPVAVETVIQW